MNYNKFLLLFLLSILLINPLVYSAQVQTSSVLSGMQIDYPKYDVIKLGNEHRFHAHVINETSVKTNRTTSCILHLYNQTGYDINLGSTAMEFEAYNGVDFTLTIAGGNFSSVGHYSYVIQCNSSNQIAFASSGIDVTANGEAIPTDFVLIFFIVVFIALLCWLIYSIFLVFRQVVSFDVDIFDTLIPVLSYIVLWAYYKFALDYFGNSFVYNFCEWLIDIGVYTHVYFPLLALALSLTIGQLIRKRRERDG